MTRAPRVQRRQQLTGGCAQGYTALHGAAFQGRAATVAALLQLGFDGRERHSDGYAAFHRACQVPATSRAAVPTRGRTGTPRTMHTPQCCGGQPGGRR